MVVCLYGCVSIHPPAQSRLFAVQGAELTQAFPQTNYLRYFVALNVKRPSKDPIYIDAWWENPCDRKNPLLTNVVLNPNQTKLLLESPALQCVEKNRYYTMSLKAFDSLDKKKPVDRLSQKIFATLGSFTLEKNLRPQEKKE